MNSDCQPAGSREFLGHPRGLAYIAFTEAWERFSFYGMQALLVLYMTEYLLRPGVVDRIAGFSLFRHALESVLGSLTPQGLASQIFGLYVGLVYFLPVLGGTVGDRLIGRKPAVLSGAALMAAGHFMMAFDALFLIALSLIIAGSGLLKGNLAAQVGELYAEKDPRRDRAFTIYVSAINVGAFLAPLACGTLGEVYGWHYGFIAAGCGMLIGTAIYLAGARYLPADDRLRRRDETTTLQHRERARVGALLFVLATTSLYWTAEAQVWNVYPLWQRDFVDRHLLGATIPVTWFQSLDSLAALVLAPMVLTVWRLQALRGKELGDLAKMTLGFGLCGAAFLVLSSGQLAAGEGLVMLHWVLVFHIVSALGYLYSVPIALALVCRAAPPALNAMLVGAFYLAIFVGGIVSGWLGRFYLVLRPAGFWATHASIALVGAVVFLAFRAPLMRALSIDDRSGPTPPCANVQ